jgi:CBS domain containing-hemolysin-like protein
MGLLIFWVMLAVVSVHFCSLLETTLFAVRASALLERRAAGSRGAGRLLEIKRNRVDDAIGAILILNTLAITVGSAFAGARAAELFGEARLGLLSAVLTALLLVFSEIVPKAMAARYAGSLSGFVGNVLWYLIRLLAPLLVVVKALIRLFARRPGERFTRREFSLLVGAAPREGAISRAESLLIGSLMYSRELPLKEIMTPDAVVFMMEAGQTVGDLLAAPQADAFSRIPLFRGERRHVAGYVSHREVLKAFALDRDRNRKLGSFLRPIPVLRETTSVAGAVEDILRQREAIALVTGKRGKPVGLVTLEDLLEAILGVEITDEARTIASLRPAVEQVRRRRAERLRRKRMEGNPPPD